MDMKNMDLLEIIQDIEDAALRGLRRTPEQRRQELQVQSIGSSARTIKSPPEQESPNERTPLQDGQIVSQHSEPRSLAPQALGPHKTEPQTTEEPTGKTDSQQPDQPGSGPEDETPAPSGPNVNRPRTQMLDELSAQVRVCERCSLCITRLNAVPGMGALHPLVLVVGEGPGADEDRHGLPFVGKAGQYLDDWLKAIYLSRQENVYITNVVKCRPPENRDPHPEELAACTPYLESQVSILRPKAILSVGRVANSVLLGEGHRMADIHGRVYQYRGISVVPTYHPAAVLRNRDLRRTVWQDLQVLHGLLNSQGHLPPLQQRS